MIVLDTHVLVWYLNNPETLSPPARELITHARSARKLYVSCMSTWELFMLEAKKRLTMTIPMTVFIRKASKLSFLQFVPVDNTIAELSVTLPEPLHTDPADRIILATSISLGCPLITKDKKLLDYPHVKTVW